MPLTLAQKLALLPDNTTGQVKPVNMRDIVGSLDEELQAAAQQVIALTLPATRRDLTGSTLSHALNPLEQLWVTVKGTGALDINASQAATGVSMIIALIAPKDADSNRRPLSSIFASSKYVGTPNLTLPAQRGIGHLVLATKIDQYIRISQLGDDLGQIFDYVEAAPPPPPQKTHDINNPQEGLVINGALPLVGGKPEGWVKVTLDGGKISSGNIPRMRFAAEGVRFLGTTNAGTAQIRLYNRAGTTWTEVTDNATRVDLPNSNTSFILRFQGGQVTMYTPAGAVSITAPFSNGPAGSASSAVVNVNPNNTITRVRIYEIDATLQYVRSN